MPKSKLFMELNHVKIVKIKEDFGSNLSGRYYNTCTFCGKLVEVSDINFKSYENLSPKNFHCSHCLRHDYHINSKNVLVVSYRGIIGFYYYKFYASSNRKLFISQIQDLIEAHVEVGLSNPVFTYDPDTFLWFVDFSKIGNQSNKAPYSEVCETFKSIFNQFDVQIYCSVYQSNQIWSKFYKAIDSYHKTKKRPKDRKMLIPTFHEIFYESDIFFEKTRNFLKSDIVFY